MRLLVANGKGVPILTQKDRKNIKKLFSTLEYLHRVKATTGKSGSVLSKLFDTNDKLVQYVNKKHGGRFTNNMDIAQWLFGISNKAASMGTILDPSMTNFIALGKKDESNPWVLGHELGHAAWDLIIKIYIDSSHLILGLLSHLRKYKLMLLEPGTLMV